MFRTVFAVGAMAIVGIVALKLMFGIFIGLVALLFVLLKWAVMIAVVGLVIYFVIRLLSPNKVKENA